MMIFRDATDNFRIGVGGSIRMLLASERKNDAGVIAADSGKLVGLLAGGDFEARPLAPQIDVGGGFDDVGDISAANAGGDLDEIKFAVGVGLQKLRVSHAAEKPQGLN